MSKSLCLVACALVLFSRLHAADLPDTPASSPEFQRGRLLYVQHCVICHMGTGLGQPGTYPPLAKSDFLLADPDRAIRILCEGLTGPIKVNGVAYNNSMPPMMLNDQQVADVLTFVLNSFGNTGTPPTADAVAKVRRTTQFPTYEQLLVAANYRPLPPAPEGFALREVARLNDFPVRLASDSAAGPLLVLSVDGTVLEVEVATGKFKTLVTARDYADFSKGSPQTLGMTVGPDHHLYLTCNQKNETTTPIQNEVTMFRSQKPLAERPVDLKPWFQTNYPFGIGPYNHGVSHIAFGPDGMIYVASGSRTDGNEPGADPRYSREGETAITAGIWRINPGTTPPAMEVYARGIRNVYGFAWNSDGEMYSVSNGPDAHAPEEMDRIQPGHHYGFPYQFSNWKKKPYPYTPDIPEGLEITLPVGNLGPAAGGSKEDPLFTFDAHSSPAGMVWLDANWPEPVRNQFLVSRFGNLIARDTDVGFDVLRVKLNGDGEQRMAEVDTFLAPLGRPIDIHLHGGAIYVCEYTRPTVFKDSPGWLPGRIIELKPLK